jgi:LmbE family N-acetylglucosaminyl deacetylase
MSASNLPSLNYSAYVQAVNDLYEKASGHIGPHSHHSLEIPQGLVLNSTPRVLIVAPHPDDECLMAGYALRMQNEWNAEVSVLPFSYGSALGRQGDRKKELEAALKVLNFQIIDPRKLNQGAPQYEKLKVHEMLDAMTQLKPQVIFSPHAGDGHPAHIETHHMVRECITQYLKAHSQEKILWVQTEFWKDMSGPNLLVPYSVAQVSLLGEALMKHAGEVSRNPYHLRLPAWFMDQVRRGSELVGGHEAPANSTVFGQIYFQIMIDHATTIY